MQIAESDIIQYPFQVHKIDGIKVAIEGSTVAIQIGGVTEIYERTNSIKNPPPHFETKESV
jgi:hypothetical protein